MKSAKGFLDRVMGWLTKAAMVFLLLYAALLAFGPPAPPPATQEITQEQVEQFLPSLKLVAAEDFPAALLDAKKPTIVLLYASWCGYCKVMLPRLLHMRDAAELSPFSLAFMSVDASQDALAHYLLAYGFDKALSPYMIKNGAGEELVKRLQARGSLHDGAIPFTLIFAPDGKLLAEKSGLLNKNAILAFTGDAVKANP